MSPFADEFVEQHFQEWLDRHEREELREETERKIRAFVASDPEFCGSKSWPELRDLAGA